jgi:phage-related protein
MRKFTVRFIQFFLLFNLLFLLTGCTAAWTTEASSIISLLEAAVPSILAILAAFGVGLAPGIMDEVTKWASQAQKDLADLKSLIDQYNTAEATAKPGILVTIQNLVGVIIVNLKTILPDIHVTNPDTQQKIMLVITAVADELVALLNLIPALKGEVTGHDAVKALMNDVKSPKEFRRDYNYKAGVFGKQYEIK